MTDVLADGNTRVAWVPTIADLAAPTVTELTAGTELQHFMTADGLVGFEAATAEVDNTSLASTFDTKDIGRASFSGTTLRLKRQSGSTDTPRDTLVRGTSGNVVIRRGLPEGTAWTAAQEIEVYPVRCGTRRNLPPEANSVEKYEVPIPITAEPELDAVVAAGP